MTFRVITYVFPFSSSYYLKFGRISVSTLPKLRAVSKYDLSCFFYLSEPLKNTSTQYHYHSSQSCPKLNWVFGDDPVSSLIWTDHLVENRPLRSLFSKLSASLSRHSKFFLEKWPKKERIPLLQMWSLSETTSSLKKEMFVVHGMRSIRSYFHISKVGFFLFLGIHVSTPYNTMIATKIGRVKFITQRLFGVISIQLRIFEWHLLISL